LHGARPLETVEENGSGPSPDTLAIGKAAVRYALVLFLSELRLCSVTCPSEQMTGEYDPCSEDR
jgi:hypothetical protein